MNKVKVGAKRKNETVHFLPVRESGEVNESEDKLASFGSQKPFTETHLLSLFCSKIARISLQYSLLASNGIFA